MFKLLILATLLAVSNAYLSHGPAILNHPNYGPYNGGYSVIDHGIGVEANYLTPYGHRGVIPAYAKAPLPVPVPTPVPVIQKLAHTGYGYAPAQNLPLPRVQVAPAPIAPAPIAPVPIAPVPIAPAPVAGVKSTYGHTPYVVAPSVTYSQTPPKQITPVFPISKAIRIPYVLPNIQMPHPIPIPADVNLGIW